MIENRIGFYIVKNKSIIFKSHDIFYLSYKSIFTTNIIPLNPISQFIQILQLFY